MFITLDASGLSPKKRSQIPCKFRQSLWPRCHLEISESRQYRGESTLTALWGSFSAVVFGGSLGQGVSSWSHGISGCCWSPGGFLAASWWFLWWCCDGHPGRRGAPGGRLGAPGGRGCRGRHGRSAVLLVSLLGHPHWHNLRLFIASATQLFEAHADVRAREGLHLAVTGSPTTGEYAENNHPQVDIHRLGPRSSRGTDALPCCAVQTCVRESNLLLPVHTVECYLRSFGCLLESTPVHKMLAKPSNCTSRCFCIMLHVGE